MAYNARIRNKRDTAANWETNNPVLLDGELIVVDTNAGDVRFKIGDGTKRYTQLPFQDESLYSVLNSKATEGYVDAAIDAITPEDIGAQAKLTFDSTPTANSSNPVTSAGIKSFVEGKGYKTTDDKVAQTVTTTDAAYPLLATATASKTATSTEGARFASGVTLNPSKGQITATKFVGDLTGNASTADSATSATTASKLGSSTVGSRTKPIYLNAGVPTECNKSFSDYLPLTGGTISNDSTMPLYLENTAEYEPEVRIAFASRSTFAGCIGFDDVDSPKIWDSSLNCYSIYHEGNKPTAADIGAAAINPADNSITATKFVGDLVGNADTATSATSASTATTASKLGSSTVGGTTTPIYLDGGTPKACSYTLGKSVPSNAVFTDTNTKVNVTLDTTRKAYLLGTSTTPTSTATAVTAYADTGVYLDTTAGTLTATKFKGDLTGNADTATSADHADSADTATSATTATTASKLGNTTLGGAGKPIYLKAGTATECTVDGTATSGSSNLINSGAVYSGLSAKLNIAGGKLTGNVTPTNAVSLTLGSYSLPFGTVYASDYEIFGGADKRYGSLSTPILGTTSKNGVCSLALGNDIASGTADNAYGRIVLYGTGQGYTQLTPSHNATGAIQLTLPSKAGTLARTADIDERITYGTDDLTAGTSELATGKLYFVYE